MTVDHERARAIRTRAAGWPIAPAVVESEFPQPWRGYGLLAQFVFFILTAVGIVTFYLLTENELLTAAVCIGLAEHLIRARRWFYTGVESALWIGGLFAALYALPRSGRPESDLVVASAAAIAGVRVRNPLFGAVAAYLVTAYFETVVDLGTLAALLIATAALFALYRTWRRPSTEWLFIVLAVTMPFAGWFHAGRQWATVTIILYSLFSAIAFAAAVVKRHHAMFAAAAAGAIVAVAVARELFALPLEITLAVSGAMLLSAAWLTMRALRGRTRGFVVTPARLTPFDDDLQSLGTMAAVLPSTTGSAGNSPEQRQEGGGRFGGAGATGDF